MKTTQFKWAWNNYPAWDDPKMTRARAAVLLRSWRACTRPSNRQPHALKRLAPGVYFVRAGGSDETATMYVGRAK